MDYYNRYGKITLAKGTKLYNWSKHGIEGHLSPNLFLCLNNSDSSSYGKILYEYKLTKPIELILTIQNHNIESQHKYSNNSINRDDYQVLTDIYNETVNPNSYGSDGDVRLKQNKTDFPILCEKLRSLEYNGLFNYIDGKTIFEIVIFEPNDHLELIKTTNKNDVKEHTLIYNKKIMLSNKIEYTYPVDYVSEIARCCIGENPSIFYYISKKKTVIM